MALVVAVLASAVPVMLASAVCVMPTTVAVFASAVAVLLATIVLVLPMAAVAVIMDWVAAKRATPVMVILAVDVAVGVIAHWQVSVPPFFQASLRSPYRSLTVKCSMIEP